MTVTAAHPPKRKRTAASRAAPPEFVPQTELGRKLFAIRRRIEASGIPMLTESEMLAEVHRRRGGTRARRRA